jgi:hypothetical protein
MVKMLGNDIVLILLNDGGSQFKSPWMESAGKQEKTRHLESVECTLLVRSYDARHLPAQVPSFEVAVLGYWRYLKFRLLVPSRAKATFRPSHINPNRFRRLRHGLSARAAPNTVFPYLFGVSGNDGTRARAPLPFQLPYLWRVK